MSERELTAIYSSIKHNRNPNQNVWVGLIHKTLAALGTPPRSITETITTLNKAWRADRWQNLIQELTVNNPNIITAEELEQWNKNI